MNTWTVSDGNHKIEFKFEKTFEDLTMGWNIYKFVPKVFIDNELAFTGKEVEVSGCSYSRASGNTKLVKQCFDFILETVR